MRELDQDRRRCLQTTRRREAQGSEVSQCFFCTFEASLADAQDLQPRPPDSDRLSYGYPCAERALDAEHGRIVVIGKSQYWRHSRCILGRIRIAVCKHAAESPMLLAPMPAIIWVASQLAAA